MDNQNNTMDESNENEDWICGICRHIYLDPHQLVPCEHVFCETCLRRLNQANIPNCPICRRQIQDTMLVEDLRNQIIETYPQHVQERAEFEQQSNVYSLDLPVLYSAEYRRINSQIMLFRPPFIMAGLIILYYSFIFFLHAF